MPWVRASVSCGSSAILAAASVVQNMREAPIGVFDSGVGGLSVLAEIRRLLPNESLLYVADCGNVPYGEKTPEFIQQRCSVMAEFFQHQGLQHGDRRRCCGLAARFPCVAHRRHGARRQT